MQDFCMEAVLIIKRLDDSGKDADCPRNLTKAVVAE